MMEDGEQKPGFIMREIQKNRCFKTGLMNGIISGLVGGLGYFLFTSNVRKAARFGLVTYGVGTLGFFTNCRVQWIVRKREEKLLKEALQNKILTEGTEDSFEKQLEREATDA